MLGGGIGLSVVDAIFEEEVDRAHRFAHSSQTKVNSSSEDRRPSRNSYGCVQETSSALNLIKRNPYRADAFRFRMTGKAFIVWGERVVGTRESELQLPTSRSRGAR